MPKLQISAGLTETNNQSKEREKEEVKDDKKGPFVDPHVKIKRHYLPRRHFTPEYKVKILSAYNACQSTNERDSLLRREGLYHSRIADWRKELAKKNLSGKNKKLSVLVRADHLMREMEQLKKKLARAEAIIDLQKKISELLGADSLVLEKREVNS